MDDASMTTKSKYDLLLVEDNSADSERIQSSLRAGLGNIRIVQVAQLDQAIELLADQMFSAVLLELNLSDGCGAETFQTLARNCNGIPIIVLSSRNDSEKARKAVADGADDYVQKRHYDAHTLSRSVRFAIERKTRRSAERELLNVRGELSAAQRIQDTLYPQCPPQLEGFDIASGIRSAGTGCGDYYDFIRLRDGRLVIVVGDVAGHGMGSAIVMAETRACLHTLMDIEVDPRAMLQAVNRLICAGTTEAMFVTLLLVVYDPARQVFEYFNAGHPGWLIQADRRVQLTTQQLPLGLIQDLDSTLSDQFRMSSGDILLIPTDGIAESFSGDVVFGNERMLLCVEQMRDRPAEEIVEELFGAALAYAETDVPNDDMTVVIVKAL